MSALTTIGAAAVAAFLAVAPVATEPAMEYVGEYRVTAYNYFEGGGENYYTAGGWTPEPYYTVAASEEFDLGTILYIEGVGEVQVQDRGNFPADRIDLHIGYDPIESWDDTTRSVYKVKKGAKE